MKNDQFAASSVLTTLKTPASVTADSSTAGVDLTQFVGLLCFLLTSLNTAGTSPTLAAKLQHAQDTDLIGTITYAGTGDGTITEVWAGADAVEEDVTVTFSNATTAAVVGSVSGALGTATVGTKFTSAKIELMLTAGGTAFVNTDAFTIPVAARTWADVVAGAFTGLTTAASVQRLALNCDGLGRFLRVNFDIGGTENPAYTVGVAMLGLKQYS